MVTILTASTISGLYYKQVTIVYDDKRRKEVKFQVYWWR